MWKVFTDVQMAHPMFQFVKLGLPLGTTEKPCLHFSLCSPFRYLYALMGFPRTFSSPGWRVRVCSAWPHMRDASIPDLWFALRYPHLELHALKLLFHIKGSSSSLGLPSPSFLKSWYPFIPYASSVFKCLIFLIGEIIGLARNVGLFNSTQFLISNSGISTSV